MKKLTVASNMFNEINALPRWFGFVKEIADGGILIVDSGSTDGTIDYAKAEGAVVIVDDIIQREGYGPARIQLRELTRKHFPDASWVAFFDADETIGEHEFHHLRFVKDYLIESYDVVAFPRIDWFDEEMTTAANDYHVKPDWQARMTQLESPLRYYRRLHEQIEGFRGIYTSLTNPKINHFHRATPAKRDFIGKLCAKLHREDTEYGHQVPEHPKEAHYRELLEKEGLL